MCQMWFLRHEKYLFDGEASLNNAVLSKRYFVYITVGGPAWRGAVSVVFAPTAEGIKTAGSALLHVVSQPCYPADLKLS